MSRWTERPKPYDRPKDYEVLTPEGIWVFVDRRIRTGMDASLYIEMSDELRRLLIVRTNEQSRQDRENRITPADLQGKAGRPRRITR